MTVLVLGVASFGIAIGALVGPLIQDRISKTLGKMSESQLQLLEEHLLVLGYGELTEPIVDELADSGRKFVVVTNDREAATRLGERDIAVVTGDPSDEDPLHRAKIDRASAILVATNHDAEDALAILTARQLAPDRRIVAGATDRENVKKLERAGADTVISLDARRAPARAIGARQRRKRSDRSHPRAGVSVIADGRGGRSPRRSRGR